MNSIANWIARWRNTLLLVALISAILPACYLPKVQIDNSFEVWLPRNRTEFNRYQEFLKKYGSDEFVVVAMDLDDPFQDQALKYQEHLSLALEALPHVDRVWSLPALAHALYPAGSDWKEKARIHPFLKNLVLGPDGKTAGIFIWFKDMKGAVARRSTMAAVYDTVKANRMPGVETHLAGAPWMNATLDRVSAHDSAIFLPLAITICVVSLVLLLRSMAGVLAAMCAVGVSATWTVGLMVMTGHALNAVTSVMPTLHFVLGLSNGIRLVSRYQDHLLRTDDRALAMERTLRELLLPLLFMSITMVVGFLSLLSSELIPVSELGVFSAVGLLIAFFSNAMIVPGLLTWLPVKPRGGAIVEGHTQHWSSRTGTAVARHPVLVLVISLILLAGSAFLLPQIKTESNVLKFFPDESELAQDYAFIGKRLTGFYSIELDIRCSPELGYRVLDQIKKFDKEASQWPHVVRVDHIGKTDLLPKQVTAQPGGGSGIFQGLADRFYSETDTDVSFRVCLLVNAMGSQEYYPLLSKTREQLKKLMPDGAVWELTGVISLLNDAQNELVDTQLRSFATAFGIIIAMMALLFFSVRAALASILPNLLPIFLTFGWMVLFHINLDAATVMIASVAIGIAVDNTIYFLARYRDERSLAPDRISALGATFNSIGAPIVFTSIVASAGFGILAFAQFQPLVYFGILTAITMMTALAGSLFLAPVCVYFSRVWEKPK